MNLNQGAMSARKRINLTRSALDAMVSGIVAQTVKGRTGTSIKMPAKRPDPSTKLGNMTVNVP